MNSLDGVGNAASFESFIDTFREEENPVFTVFAPEDTSWSFPNKVVDHINEEISDGNDIALNTVLNHIVPKFEIRFDAAKFGQAYFNLYQELCAE